MSEMSVNVSHRIERDVRFRRPLVGQFVGQRARQCVGPTTRGLPWVMAALFLCLAVCACTRSETNSLSEEELGELLFFDQNLSARGTQACASCHDPARGFVDGRLQADGYVRSGSLGDDGSSIGDRNAPTAAYAQFSPPFAWVTRRRFNTDGDFSSYEGYVGGQFHDGRASDLAEQAAGPFLNPAEMAMADEAAVVERIREEPLYVEAFEQLYGERVLDEPKDAYEALTGAIAAFERTPEFAPFDSRYDRSLLPVGDRERYEYDPASRAAAGKALFFSTEFTNCAACHQLNAQGSAGAKQEVFTGFEYHNLGVPEHTSLREVSGGERDLGLGAIRDERAEDGKFKTPTLRNVAITGPYMHNGIFRELTTVLRFYEHAKRRVRGDEDPTLNPESGAPWAPPEVAENVSERELASGNKDLYDVRNLQALECFLMTLTDARYEPLLDPDKVLDCGL